VKQKFSNHSEEVYNEINDYIVSLDDIWGNDTNVSIYNVIRENNIIYWYEAGKKYFIHYEIKGGYPEIKENIPYYCLCIQSHDEVREFEEDGGVLYKNSSQSQKDDINKEISNIKNKISDNYNINDKSNFADFLSNKMADYPENHLIGSLSLLISEK
jgi:hypothetical protein